MKKSKSNTCTIETYKNETLKTLKKRIELHEASIHVSYADAAELTQIIKKLKSYKEAEKALIELNKTLSKRMNWVKEHTDKKSLINWVIKTNQYKK